MHCVYCGSPLLVDFPSIVCNDCFYEKKEELIKKVTESGVLPGSSVIGCSGYVGVVGFSGVSGVSGPVGVVDAPQMSLATINIDSTDPIPASYFIYSERAGTKKKKLGNKWRMLRFTKAKRMIR